MPRVTPPPDETGTAPRPLRTVRSFVPRAGRMTRAQHRAWQDLWPRLGLDPAGSMLDLDAAFGRCARRTVEIGFGNGEALVALAAAQPAEDFLGIEVHRPGVGHLMLRCEELAVGNLRIVSQDAVDVLEQRLPPACLDEVLLYFPDPWPKKRHHKRRLVQPAFVHDAATALAEGGVWRLATDWAEYADAMRAALDAEPMLTGGVTERWEERPLTRFERRGLDEGRAVIDLTYRRV